MTDEEKIIARILDVIPPRSFKLTTFLSLFRVRFSEKTKTACVTCGCTRNSCSTRNSSMHIAGRTSIYSCS